MRPRPRLLPLAGIYDHGKGKWERVKTLTSGKRITRTALFPIGWPTNITPLFAESSGTRTGKLDEVLYFREFRDFRFDAGQRVGNGEAFPEEDLERLAERGLRFIGDAVALQADFIDGARLGRIAVYEHEWRDILNNF